MRWKMFDVKSRRFFPADSLMKGSRSAITPLPCAAGKGGQDLYL